MSFESKNYLDNQPEKYNFLEHNYVDSQEIGDDLEFGHDDIMETQSDYRKIIFESFSNNQEITQRLTNINTILSNGIYPMCLDGVEMNKKSADFREKLLNDIKKEIDIISGKDDNEYLSEILQDFVKEIDKTRKSVMNANTFYRIDDSFYDLIDNLEIELNYKEDIENFAEEEHDNDYETSDYKMPTFLEKKVGELERSLKTGIKETIDSKKLDSFAKERVERFEEYISSENIDLDTLIQITSYYAMLKVTNDLTGNEKDKHLKIVDKLGDSIEKNESLFIKNFEIYFVSMYVSNKLEGTHKLKHDELVKSIRDQIINGNITENFRKSISIYLMALKKIEELDAIKRKEALPYLLEIIEMVKNNKTHITDTNAYLSLDEILNRDFNEIERKSKKASDDLRDLGKVDLKQLNSASETKYRKSHYQRLREMKYMFKNENSDYPLLEVIIDDLNLGFIKDMIGIESISEAKLLDYIGIFQKKHGLKADKLFGPKTYAKILEVGRIKVEFQAKENHRRKYFIR